MNTEEIITLAARFRTAIENTPDLPVPFDTFPKGCCGDTSDLLAQWLWDNGYESRYYCGRRASDQATHAWLEVYDLIVDITGDQFSDFTESVYIGPLTPFHIAFHIPDVEHDMVNGFHIYDAGSVAKLEWMYKKILEHIPASDVDYHLTPDQVNYIKSQQAKATALVSDPTSPYYEPDPEKEEQLVSVIIPVYNVRPYLCEALDSVLGQTYQNLEILIIDDGSDDGSERICDEYGKKDSRITVIHQENRGLSTARNVGLNRVTGEYVAFLDPDDAFHPNMIRRLVEAMQRTGAEMAVCGIINCHTLHRMERKRYLLRAEYRQEEVLEKKAALAALTAGFMAGYVWNKLYVSELWNEVRFPNGHVYEDVCTLIRIFEMAERTVTVPGCPVRHRIRPGSITRTWSVQNARDWLWARKQMEDYVEKNTPELFVPGMLGQVRNQTIHGMVVTWTRIKKHDREYADNLRREILEKGQGLDLGTLDLRSRLAYQLLRFCPWIVPMLLPVYQFVRQLYTGMTGR